MPTPTYTYAVPVSGTLFVSSGSNGVKFAPNQNLVLKSKATGAPAVIYSNENFTVLNSSGTVTTDSLGEWTAFVSPAVEAIIPFYKGVARKAIAVYASPKEADVDIAAFKTATGLDAIGSGEHVATREWIAQNVTAGLTDSQIRSIVADQVTTKVAEIISAVPTSPSGGLTQAQVDARIVALSQNPVLTTTAGPPTSGTYARGRLALDTANRVWICTAAPNTWKPVAPLIISNTSQPTSPYPGDFWVRPL